MANAIRVLQLISPTGFYGAERWILALSRHLGEHDVECDLAVTSEEPNRQFELLKRFPTDNGMTHRIELSNRFDWKSVNALRRIIQERHIDIIHTHGYKSDIIGWLVARRCKVPCISSPHGFGHGNDRKLRILIRIGAFALRRHDKVVPLSRQLFDETVGFGVPRENIKLIGNGVDLVEIDETVSQRCIEVDRPGKRIGYVGQLIPRKRIHDLITVFDALWKHDHSRTLDIAGDGSERYRLQEMASSLKCSSAIRFHGFVEERLKLMREMDLFVMTSEEEGIPRCLMEAQGIGVPVAAYDIDGVNDLIINGKTGLLSPLGDCESLFIQCQQLLCNRNEAKRMVKHGRERVREYFSAERMAKDYVDLYHSLATQL